MSSSGQACRWSPRLPRQRVSRSKTQHDETMQRLQFSIEMRAPKERVWNTLWEDKTFRDWANIVDEGMYMVGEIKEGNQVQFISSVSGYGVTSLIEKLALNEFVSLRQMTDTKDGGQREREWAGGLENYSLAEDDGVTTLTIEVDTPPGQEETFGARLPKALERIKTLAEKGEQGFFTEEKLEPMLNQCASTAMTNKSNRPLRQKKSQVINGYTVKYHASGKTVWSKGKMSNGQADGYWEWYRPDGTLKRSGHFEEGMPVGEWTTYDQEGKVYKVTNKGTIRRT
jgi:hypothetical protein